MQQWVMRSSGKSKEDIDNTIVSFKDFLGKKKADRYKEFLFIPISHETATGMTKTMIRKVKEPYNMASNNCMGAVISAMHENGLRTPVIYSMTPNKIFQQMRDLLYY